MTIWSGELDGKGTDMLLYAVLLVPLVLGAGHHIDHIIRGNHVGWPLTPEVNPFTYSLAVYPLFVVGVYLTVKRWYSTEYWIGFFVASSVLIGYTHAFIEPPGDIIRPHSSEIVGYAAFMLMLALLASVIVGAAAMIRGYARGNG